MKWREIIYLFVDDLFLYPPVKIFQNRLTIDEILAKVQHFAFLKHSVESTPFNVECMFKVVQGQDGKAAGCLI